MADLAPTVASLSLLSGYGDSYVKPGDEVYVVSDDVFYTYRNTGVNPPADGFDIVKAVNLPGIWERGSPSGGTTLSFNTVAVGASGSGRLIDVAVSGLSDGVSQAWVKSVRSYFRWDATSTATANNITVVNPTLNGANPGRFVRDFDAAIEWMQQLTWFIDPVNGNDENSGATSVLALKSGLEFNRRTGPFPTWNAGDYHITIMNDLIDVNPGDAADSLTIGGIRTCQPGQTNAAHIFLHGSTTPGNGKATLFTGTVNAVQAVSRNTTPQHSLEITSNAIPVSWTASGLINTSATVAATAARIRFTAGQAVNGYAWAVSDLGAKAAKLSPAMTSDIPFNVAPTAVPSNIVPAVNDTFVVESLVRIDKLSMTVTNTDWTNTPGNQGWTIVESLCLGQNELLIAAGDLITFEACFIEMQPVGGANGRQNFVGCGFGAIPVLIRSALFTGIYGGASFGHQLLVTGLCEFSSDFIVQGPVAESTGAGAGIWITNGGNANVNPASGSNGVACFACTNGIVVDRGGTLALANNNARLWGDGNTTVGIDVRAGSRFLYTQTTNLKITGGTSDFAIKAATTCRAFDDTQGAGATYTAARATTWALLATTVVGGGFGSQIHDPVSGAVMTLAP